MPGYLAGRYPSGSLLPYPSDSWALGIVAASVPCHVAAGAQLSPGHHHPVIPDLAGLAWLGTL